MSPKRNIEFTTMATIKKRTKLSEALLILETETQKKIEEIQQQVKLTCDSIRDQGTKHLNNLPKSVRDLTIAEYCETYGEFSEKEQLLESEFQDSNIQQQFTETLTLSNTDSPVKNKTETKCHKVETQRNRADTQCDKAKIQCNNVETEFNEAEISCNEAETSCNKAETSCNEAETSCNEARKLSTKVIDILTENQASSEKFDTLNKKRHKSNNEIPSNYEFEPLFVHFERKDHPKFSILLNPERSVTEKFKLNAPTEIFTQLNDIQRTTIRDQIQDLQDQLSKLLEILS